MWICNFPDIFQDKMNEMFCGIEFIRAYIHDLLITNKGDWYDNLNTLELVLKNLERIGLSAILKSHSLDRPR